MFAQYASDVNITNETLQRQIYQQIKGFESAVADEQQRIKSGARIDTKIKVEVALDCCGSSASPFYNS